MALHIDLNEADAHTLTHALEIAAERFEERARNLGGLAGQSDAYARLRDQFLRQAKDTRDLNTRLIEAED